MLFYFAPTHLEEELAGTSIVSFRNFTHLNFEPVGVESNKNRNSGFPSLIANTEVVKRCGVKTVKIDSKWSSCQRKKKKYFLFFGGEKIKL